MTNNPYPNVEPTVALTAREIQALIEFHMVQAKVAPLLRKVEAALNPKLEPKT